MLKFLYLFMGIYFGVRMLLLVGEVNAHEHTNINVMGRVLPIFKTTFNNNTANIITNMKINLNGKEVSH